MSQLKDPNTFSNINDLATEHLDLELEVDFESKILKGCAVLRLAVKNPRVGELILDTDFLIVNSVLCNTEPKRSLHGQEFRVGFTHRFTGGRTKDWVEIKIGYQTTKAGGAIQFLEPK
ncbi:Leucyl aminopeptidase yscIV [Massospora cicadina]|nr:Leucyl aminopeptidase yscIV [Massospora cicadina]